ncbi:MAG: Pr6Pr family membrane protein [Bauldia sp.]|nr:Pr6Pr family membrane protein [Bauldia sp.]
MRNAYGAVAAVVGWGALAVRAMTMVGADADGSIIGRTIDFLSLFTILSNAMAAVVLTVAALGAGRSRLLGFFTLPTVQTGVAVYLTITGIGYLLVLRTMSDAQGWAHVADTVLHGAMPLVYVGFWLLFVAKGTLRIGDVVGFLGFPVAYVAYLLVRGPLVDAYPYPFLDVGVLGIGPVAINVFAIAAALVLVGLAYIALDRVMGGARGRVAVS